MSVLSEQFLQREKWMSKQLAHQCPRHSAVLDFALFVFGVGAVLFYHVEIVRFAKQLWSFLFM